MDTCQQNKHCFCQTTKWEIICCRCRVITYIRRDEETQRNLKFIENKLDLIAQLVSACKLAKEETGNLMSQSCLTFISNVIVASESNKEL